MIRKSWALALLAAAAALPASAHVGPTDAFGYYWVDDREPGHEFVDPRYDNATPLALVGSATAPVPLPFVMPLYGRTYDHVEATSDGKLVLRFFGSQRQLPGEHGYPTIVQAEPRGDVAVLDVFAGVSPGTRSQVVLSQAATQISVRWVEFESSPREAVTFEAQLRMDGRVRFQYWQMRPYLTGPSYGTVGRIALNDPNGGPGVVVMNAGDPAPGFDLRSGSVVEFPGDGVPRVPGGGDDQMLPMALPQCPPAFGLPADFRNWCERTAAGPDGVPGTGDENTECTVNTTDGTHTPCTQGTATEWLFREGNDYCQDCPYTFYVVVDCGTDMHMPTRDVEAMQVQITDMITGLPRTITAENECARLRDAGTPLVFCDGCGTPLGGIVRKDEAISNPPIVDKPANTCNATSIIGPISLPELECLAYRETGTTVAWGTPLDQTNPDTDGSGFLEQDEMNTPPCDTCGNTTPPPEGPCSCGTDTNANRATENMDIDVVLFGTPSLTGVFRLEILSGGLEWQLYTNCDGDNAPQYPIFDTCAAAIAAYEPLPELLLSSDPATGFGFNIVDASGCPSNVRVAVTICNQGGATTSTAPFTIRFTNGAGAETGRFEGDIATATDCDLNAGLPLESDECRTCYFNVNPGAADVTARLDVDFNGVVTECSEDPTATRCTLDTGSESRRIPACSANCLADAVLVVDGDPFCVGASVPLDGNRSTMTSCSGVPEYQFEEFNPASGNYEVIPGGAFSPAATFNYVPPTTGSHRVRVVVRCSTDTSCSASSSSVTFTVLPDVDNDRISEDCGDNCPTVSNPLQADADRDFVGDDCDNCPAKFNTGQENSDGDPLGDECDNCRFDTNPGQENDDTDLLGNACDNCLRVDNDQLNDWDGDGLAAGDVYGEFPQSDLDGDGVGDLCDNCPLQICADPINPTPDCFREVSNPTHAGAPFDCNGDGDTTDAGEAIGEQCDQDGDGVGDACDNCIGQPNPRTEDAAGFDCDGDGTIENGPGQEASGEFGLDQCDNDADGLAPACDNCPARFNPTQADSDEDPPGSGTLRPDGVGNACDNCPFNYNPVNTAPTDCNGDGDTSDADEAAGVQCVVCSGCAVPPAEVLSAIDPDGHLVMEKSLQTAAIFVTSRDPGPAGDYSADLFGTPTVPGVLEKFNVYRGTILSLWQPGPITDPSRYDHIGDLAEGCGVVPGAERVETRVGSVRPARGIYDADGATAGRPHFYYLVTAACDGGGGLFLEADYGYASPGGTDRSQLVPPSATMPCP